MKHLALIGSRFAMKSGGPGGVDVVLLPVPLILTDEQDMKYSRLPEALIHALFQVREVL